MSLEAHTLVVTRSRHNYKVEAAGGHCTELHQAQPSSLTQPDATLASKQYITLYCTLYTCTHSQHCTAEYCLQELKQGRHYYKFLL